MCCTSLNFQAYFGLDKTDQRVSASSTRTGIPPQIVHKDCITAVADLVIPFVEECRWFWSDTKAPLLPSCGNTALLSVCQAKHSSALSSMCVQRPHLEWGGQPGWDLTIYWKSMEKSFKWGDWHIWCFLLNPGLWFCLFLWYQRELPLREALNVN